MSDIKNIQSGAVTSIGDTDLVMCSIGGTYHPISFANLMAAVRGGIQIGGRNLLKGTYSAAVLNGQGTASKYYPYAQVISWPEWVGKYMTISFDYDCENVATGASAMSSRIVLSVSIEVSSKTLYYEAVVGIPLSSTNYSASGRKVFTFKVPEGATGTKTTQALNIQVLSGNVRVWNVKIEEGNMATAWTPAPEDIASGAWGGVIGLYTINYNSNRKGGAHERHQEAKFLAEHDISCAGPNVHCNGRLVSTKDSVRVSACDDADAFRENYNSRNIRIHKKAADGICHLSNLLGDDRLRCRGCAADFRDNKRHRTEVSVLLFSRSIESGLLRKNGRQMLPLHSGRRASSVPGFLITVKRRKEVAV